MLNEPLFWQAVMFVAGLVINIYTYKALVKHYRDADERREKQNLLSDGENSYKFECMWSDYKKTHNIHSPNGGH